MSFIISRFSKITKILYVLQEKQIECNKTHKMSRECEILNKKYALLNQKYTDEHDAFSKKVAFLVQQIKEYEVTLANLTADVKSLKETNIKLQKRYLHRYSSKINVVNHRL